MTMSNDCRRCTYPEAVRGYCEACTEYLCGVVEENLAQYAGYTEAEWRDYADDQYSFAPSPVCTANWDDESWMAYIWGVR